MERIGKEEKNIFIDKYRDYDDSFDINKEASFDYNKIRLEILANQIKTGTRPVNKMYNF